MISAARVSFSQRRITDVSSPPEYARTIFILSCEACEVLLQRLPDQDDRNLILVPKTNVHVPRGLDHFAIYRDETQAVDCVSDRHIAHLVILITDHRPVAA